MRAISTIAACSWNSSAATARDLSRRLLNKGTASFQQFRERGRAEAASEMLTFQGGGDIGHLDSSCEIPTVDEPVGIGAVPNVARVQGIDRVNGDRGKRGDLLCCAPTLPDQCPGRAERH